MMQDLPFYATIWNDIVPAERDNRGMDEGYWVLRNNYRMRFSRSTL